jgi:hypothetical protein
MGWTGLGEGVNTPVAWVVGVVGVEGDFKVWWARGGRVHRGAGGDVGEVVGWGVVGVILVILIDVVWWCGLDVGGYGQGPAEGVLEG